MNKVLNHEGFDVIRLWGHDIKAGLRPIELLNESKKQ